MQTKNENRNNRIESGTSHYWKNYSAYQISRKSVRDSVLFFEPISYLKRHITNIIDLKPVDRPFFTLDKFVFFSLEQYSSIRFEDQQNGYLLCFESKRTQEQERRDEGAFLLKTNISV